MEADHPTTRNPTLGTRDDTRSDTRLHGGRRAFRLGRCSAHHEPAEEGEEELKLLPLKSSGGKKNLQCEDSVKSKETWRYTWRHLEDVGGMSIHEIVAVLILSLRLQLKKKVTLHGMLVSGLYQKCALDITRLYCSQFSTPNVSRLRGTQRADSSFTKVLV